jgi:signal transduction histidine kinase
MRETLLIDQIMLLLINISGLWFGFWVWFAGFKKRANQSFALMTIFILLWIDFAYLNNFSNDVNKSLVYGKIVFGVISLFFVSAYLFSVYFLSTETKTKIHEKIIFIVGIIFFIVSISTNLIIKSVQFTNWGTNLIIGEAGIIFYITVLILTILIITQLINKYRKLSGKDKIKIIYLLLGAIIFAFANLFFNVLLPFAQGTHRFYQFGNYSAILFLGFTAYAIVRQNLFGIRVVLTTLLVGLIAILLLIDTAVLTKDSPLQIIKGVTLILFLFFGYYLIRSVLREIKLREELEKAYVELKKLDKAKSEFISIASHQLRTPLAAMKGYISMILDESYGPVGGQVKTKLQNVFFSNERLIHMVNDLLNVSRIESGRVEMAFQETAIEDVISSVIDILKLPAQNKKLKLIWEKPKTALPKAYIDPDKTREIILNIIDNAIKYTPQGKIEIKAKAKTNFISVSVSDTGAGMSEEEIGKMFKSFSRGSAGNQFFTEGMGLGLYIAQQFIDMQHGKIWAESPGKGKGSTFFVELPLNWLNNL